MTNKYKQLTESIKGRINPEKFSFQKAFSDELSTLSYSEVLTYIRLGMKGVEPEYTQKSREAGEKVKNHLSESLNDVVFQYQGSVMTDTHIRGHSDIDLLTICNKYYSYDSNGITNILESWEKKSRYSTQQIERLTNTINSAHYKGNSIEDLKHLRIDSENILKDIYPICKTTNPKSIKIKNKSLNRDVDIVIAQWYHDVSTIITNDEKYKGIQVFNKDTNACENPDFPFLSISRINERSSITKGRLKKMIRFLKNVKADSQRNIELSSFDINAICYDIDVSLYQNLSFYELIPILYSQLKTICINKVKASSIVSVDGKEYIFLDKPDKIENIKKLFAEIEGVFYDLKKDINL
ncbi:MAG: hypothetical protein MUC87_01620 [Bacteroidia bacterium]|jgi:hypothetical protein|nr:hypothetical protein [Bacteroidia bacterium]